MEWDNTTNVGVSISGDDQQIATSLSVSNNGARAYPVAHLSAGKHVFEMQYTASPNNSAGAGLAAQSVDYATFTSSVNSVIQLPQGSTFINGAQPGSIGSFNGASTRIVFAVDLDAKKIWVKQLGALWNNIALVNSDPATGAGGFSISALTFPVGPVMCGAGGAGSIRELYMHAEDLLEPLPAGFSAWQASAPGGGGAVHGIKSRARRRGRGR